MTEAPAKAKAKKVRDRPPAAPGRPVGTRKQRTFRKGVRVLARGFGKGVILGEWGAFQGCPNCTALVGGGLQTKCCGRAPVVVPGNNIFDVELDGGRPHPFHISYLSLEETP